MHRAPTLLAACAIPSIYAVALQVLCTSSFIFTRRITLCINEKKAFLDFSYSRTLAFQSTDSVYESCDCTCIVLVNTLQDTKQKNYIIMNEHMQAQVRRHPSV